MQCRWEKARNFVAMPSELTERVLSPTKGARTRGGSLTERRVALDSCFEPFVPIDSSSTHEIDERSEP